jgi:hypothetical protein
MEQEEFMAKVMKAAKERVDLRIGVFKGEITTALTKLCGKNLWFSLDGGDSREEIIKAYFSTEGPDKWPKFLYEKEEKLIVDELLEKANKSQEL